MKQQLQRPLVLALALSLCSAIASADLIPVGLLSYEDSGVTFDGATLFDFELTNMTGTNASTFPVTTWPVETSLTFLDVSLLENGSSATCNLISSAAVCLETNVMTATLSGEFDLTTITLNDGTVQDIAPNAFFGSTGSASVTITDATGACFGGGTGCLQNGDSAVVYAETTSTTAAAVPEPYSVVLLATVCAALVCLRRRMKWDDVG